MSTQQYKAGLDELKSVRRESRGLLWAVGIFSFFANLLMLTGPLYMLQVYDRVLGSRSEATLIALTLLVAFLYGMMGILDYVRGRVLARVGARFQSRLDQRVFEAAMMRSVRGHETHARSATLDLESIQRFVTSPLPIAFYDIPWTPIFLAGIALFHPWLGYLALGGGLVLVAVTLLNQYLSKDHTEQASRATQLAQNMGEQLRNESELVTSLGMQKHAFLRWMQARSQALTRQMSASDVSGGFGSVTKTFRLFLQSAMLGLGAYLALHGDITPGAMIAGSILLGRALAPVEMAIGQWSLGQRAYRGWWNLAQLLTEVPETKQRTELPKPSAKLEVQSLTLVPPGEKQATLRLVSFAVQPGQALGVIGQSGAGKSTLARALTSVWKPAGGKVRLDGASIDHYDPTQLGEYIGYLPQRVQLFDGTIADNIARLALEPDSAKVVAAARKADAHEMILKLPEGYDTKVSSSGGRLSGGQMQRIGLARALYSDPVILVLDEPNSNLDNQGSEALNLAIRTMKSEGKSVIIMAHRPAAIRECDVLLVLENGQMSAFGPRDEVLEKTVVNHRDIRRAQGQGGVR